MRVLITIIVVLIISRDLKAQSASDSLVLTKEQNDKWISEFASEAKLKQLYLLRKRMLADTNVYIRQSYNDRIKFDYESDKGSGVVGYGKPLLFINGRYLVYVSNRTKGRSIIKLAEFLVDNKIKNISIVTGSSATAIYGTRAVCGVILLTTKDKRTFRKIKEINLNVN